MITSNSFTTMVALLTYVILDHDGVELASPLLLANSGLDHRRPPAMVGAPPRYYLLLFSRVSNLADCSATAVRVAPVGALFCCAEEAHLRLQSRFDLCRAHRVEGLQPVEFQQTFDAITVIPTRAGIVMDVT